jgi:hypothetical protein
MPESRPPKRANSVDPANVSTFGFPKSDSSRTSLLKIQHRARPLARKASGSFDKKQAPLAKDDIVVGLLFRHLQRQSKL